MSQNYNYIELDCAAWGKVMNFGVEPDWCCYYCHKNICNNEMPIRTIDNRVYSVCCNVKKVCLKLFVSG